MINTDAYDWSKWYQFEHSDSLISKISNPDFNESLTKKEAQQLAKDFEKLRNRFRNFIAWYEGTEQVLDEFLDKIHNLSDSELLLWRKTRNDKILADADELEKFWNMD